VVIEMLVNKNIELMKLSISSYKEDKGIELFKCFVFLEL